MKKNCLYLSLGLLLAASARADVEIQRSFGKARLGMTPVEFTAATGISVERQNQKVGTRRPSAIQEISVSTSPINIIRYYFDFSKSDILNTMAPQFDCAPDWIWEGKLWKIIVDYKRPSFDPKDSQIFSVGSSKVVIYASDSALLSAYKQMLKLGDEKYGRDPAENEHPCEIDTVGRIPPSCQWGWGDDKTNIHLEYDQSFTDNDGLLTMAYTDNALDHRLEEIKRQCSDQEAQQDKAKSNAIDALSGNMNTAKPDPKYGEER